MAGAVLGNFVAISVVFASASRVLALPVRALQDWHTIGSIGGPRSLPVCVQHRVTQSNEAIAHDLATLVKAAHEHQIIRELSTSPQYQVAVGKRQLQFRNTNLLVRNPTWDIGLQKTGYISEAGRCLVMQAQLAGRKLIMVFLDSAGKYSRIGDAERVRKWINETTPTALAAPKVTS